MVLLLTPFSSRCSGDGFALRCLFYLSAAHWIRTLSILSHFHPSSNALMEVVDVASALAEAFANVLGLMSHHSV